jgi:hypothetical protein
MAGAPRKNQNAERGARFRKALDAVIKRRGGQAAIEEVVEALMVAATNGEQWAVREFFDRMEGKAHQSISTENETTVRHLISDEPMSKDEWTKQYAGGVATPAGTTESTH